MRGYAKTRHPITGEKIIVFPTGKVEGDKAEFLVLSPRSNLTRIWLQRGDILAE